MLYAHVCACRMGGWRDNEDELPKALHFVGTISPESEKEICGPSISTVLYFYNRIIAINNGNMFIPSATLLL